MTQLHTSADVFDEARSWQYRVILASAPTNLGVLVRAVLGKNTRGGWAMGLTGWIDAQGIVYTRFRVPGGGEVPQEHAVGPIASVRDNFRLLADHCKLNDQDREELFTELRKWISRDMRAQSGLDAKRHN